VGAASAAAALRLGGPKIRDRSNNGGGNCAGR